MSRYWTKKVYVKFYANNRPYAYQTDLNVKVGDTVVVGSVNDLVLATVVHPPMNPDGYNGKIKWIVDKVNTARHEERKAEENSEKSLRMADLFKKLVEAENTLKGIRQELRENNYDA